MEEESSFEKWNNRMLRVINRQQAAPRKGNPERHNPKDLLQVSHLISRKTQFPRFNLSQIGYPLAFISFENMAENKADFCIDS